MTASDIHSTGCVSLLCYPTWKSDGSGPFKTFLCFISAEVHIDNLRVPQTLRANDHAIMETFLDTHPFSDKDLLRLNLCRIHLRVEFLSEICDPDGDNILPEVWQGRRPQ